MKETSAASSAVHSDIVTIQNTLASMTIEEFIHLPISKIRHLADLFEVVKTDEQFAVAFPKDEVLKSQELVCAPATVKEVRCLFINDDTTFTNWCFRKLRERIENCAFKIRQMLEGATFESTEIASKRMRAYQKLYNVVSDSNESLEDRRIARAKANAEAHQQ